LPKPYDEDKPASRSAGYRVMVVEDSQVLFKVIKSQLQKLGIGVDHADNGFEAVRLYQTGENAAILMDCQMPVMDGYEAAGIIRALERKGSGHIPIIGITASSAADSRENCMQAGMDDHITKPFDLETLARTLIKWVPALKDVIKMPKGGKTTALPAPQRASVINMEQLKAYVGDDEEVRRFVISDYLKNSHLRMESLRQALTSKDGPEIKRLAHGIKAVNAFVGAQYMVDILIKMEEYALSNKYNEEEGLFVELVKNHDLVYQALSRLVE